MAFQFRSLTLLFISPLHFTILYFSHTLVRPSNIVRTQVPPKCSRVDRGMVASLSLSLIPPARSSFLLDFSPGSIGAKGRKQKMAFSCPSAVAVPFLLALWWCTLDGWRAKQHPYCKTQAIPPALRSPGRLSYLFLKPWPEPAGAAGALSTLPGCRTPSQTRRPLSPLSSAAVTRRLASSLPGSPLFLPRVLFQPW